jgi:hypothetical protein
MQRRDYVIIAQAISDSINSNGKIYKSMLLDNMTKALQADNEKFNSKIFLAYIEANK